MAFADFLDVMHQHSVKESLPKELLQAFRGSDPRGKGSIPAKDLWHILVKWGEKLSPREGNQSIIKLIEYLFTFPMVLQWTKSSTRPTSRRMAWSATTSSLRLYALPSQTTTN